MGKRDILPLFRALWQGVDATQCRAGGDWFRGPPTALVGANLGWHLLGAGHQPAFGGCGPLVRTTLQTPVLLHCADQRSASTLRGSLRPALERLL
ncbi:Hypothetical protein EPM1_0980 [Stenotrophomonas maltophilia EPM1]|nr:Hypothetical protein EPM1_0980 [Stenotrophomonas maltophilia EPM1]